MSKLQKGQSLLEFALILPLLIVLTLGGVFFIMSFTHKSIMNGLAFMSARASIVRDNPQNSSELVKNMYLKKTDSKWLKEVIVKAYQDNQDIKVVLEKEGEYLEILANSLNIISGKGDKYSPKKITCSVLLPSEYIKDETGSSRPQTRNTVDYKYTLSYNFLDNVLSKVIDSTQMADDKKLDDTWLSTSPTNKNIKKLYEKWGIKYDSVDIYPELVEKGGKLNTMKQLAENFKLLETGTDVVQTILTAFGGDILEKILAEVGDVVGSVFEKSMITLGEVVDKHERESFKN